MSAMPNFDWFWADPWGHMTDDAKELATFMQNDYDLWMRRRLDFWKNLDRHEARGVFDTKKAVKGLGHFVSEGAKKYGHRFDPSDREQVAKFFVCLWSEDHSMK